MSQTNYQVYMDRSVSIMDLSEQQPLGNFIIFDKDGKQYYAGAYNLEHLDEFVNANEPESDFSAFQATLRSSFGLS